MITNTLQNIPKKLALILNVIIILLCPADITASQPSKANSKTIEDSQAFRTNLHFILPSHFIPRSPLETYSPLDLYEVINGQADLYLKAGFVKLATQQLKFKNHPAQWVEVNIYQMNRHLSAFAVYSVQRRPNAIRLEITPYAYQAQYALFLVHDCFYVEIIGSNETDPLISAMKQFAQAFVDQHPARIKPIPELSLFPNPDLIPDSLVLFPEGAFGFDRFKDVFVAKYNLKDDQVTAFMSRCPNQSEAAELSIAYQKYLMEYGGENVSFSIRLPNANLIRIHDMFEFVFTHNVFVAGVHQAPTQKAAEHLAKQLAEHLSAANR